MYKRALNNSERAEIYDYTDNLLAHLSSEGFHESYYADTSAGAQIHLEGRGSIKIAVRMKLDGTIIHKQYNK